MNTLYIGLAGTVIFLLLTVLSYSSKKLAKCVTATNFSWFILPMVFFSYILSLKFYILFKDAGCSYKERQDFIEPSHFQAQKKTGILLFYINGFGNCQATVTMNSGKTYSTESLSDVFAIVLPADSGKVDNIVVDGKDTLYSDLRFAIKPGKLTYAGSFTSPKDFTQFIPSLASKSANFGYETPSEASRSRLRSWAGEGRLVLTADIRGRVSALQESYQGISKMVGLQLGYLPFTSKSLNGKVKSMTPEEVKKQYQLYEFMVK